MLVLDGIIVYAMLHHLAISRKGENRRLHSLFALVCLLTLLLTGAHVQTIESRSVGTYLWHLKIEHAFALALAYLLTVFVIDYAGQLCRAFAVWLGVAYGGLIITDFALPYSLQFTRFYGIGRYKLPWGQVITIAKGHAGPTAALAALTVALSFLYAFWRLLQTYRLKRTQTKLWMLLAFGVVVLGTAESILVRLELIHAPILTPYDIIGMIALMSAFYLRESRLQLETAESNSRDLFENSPTAMVAFSPETGRIVEANQVAIDLSGYTREEFLSRKVTEFEIKGDFESFEQLLDRLKSGHFQRVNYESQLIRKDGRPLLTDMYFSTVEDNAGRVVRIIANAIDVTEARLAQKAIQRESEKNREILRSASDGINIVDINGNLVEASDSFCKLLGRTHDELIGRNISEWNAVASGSEIRELIGNIVSKNEHHVFETYHQKKDGTVFPVEIASTPIVLDGQPYLFNSSRDITVRMRALDALRESETRFHTLFATSPVGISYSREGILLGANSAYKTMHGLEQDADLTGRHEMEFLAEDDGNDLQRHFDHEADTLPGAFSCETTGLRQDGSRFPAFISITHAEMPDRPITFTYTLDFTELKQREKQIQTLAFYDQITQLPNRQLMNDRLQLALSNAERTRHFGAVLLIDIDNFKSLNDTLGHEYGDMLLRQLSKRLLENLGTGDTLARLGGDEFLVILESLSHLEIEAIGHSEATGQKLLQEFEHPFMLDGREYRCTASIGITLFNNSSLSIDERIKQAEIAMYQAKNAGRNMLRFFDPRMQDSVNSRARDESDLYKAIDQQQFELHYQLQVDGDRKPLGAEALIRWHHPSRGQICPCDFIPLSEETGQILTIGQWVIDAACQQIRLWQEDNDLRRLTLSVNVSSLQFHQPDFVTLVKKALQRHAVPPALLKIELTESVLLDNVEHGIATMQELKRLGIQFSLDDFGTGYSSLQYLKRLPLDQLKIDKSFITGIAENRDDLSIVQTIITMADKLGFEVIAEGVETEQQRTLLADMGCTVYQGYLFGRPLPRGEFEASFIHAGHAQTSATSTS